MESSDAVLPHHSVVHVVVTSFPQDEGGVSVVQLPGGDPQLTVDATHVFEGGRVSGVVVVHPVLPLPPQQRDVLAVDHHHVVPAVGGRVEHRLILALKHLVILNFT